MARAPCGANKKLPRPIITNVNFFVQGKIASEAAKFRGIYMCFIEDRRYHDLKRYILSGGVRGADMRKVVNLVNLFVLIFPPHCANS